MMPRDDDAMMRKEKHGMIEETMILSSFRFHRIQVVLK